MSLLKKYNIEVDPRLKIAHKEMIITFVVLAMFCFFGIGTAWFLTKDKTITEIHYIFGFPAWYFWAVIVVSLIFLLVTSFVVLFIFKDCSLDPWIYGEEKKEVKK